MCFLEPDGQIGPVEEFEAHEASEIADTEHVFSRFTDGGNRLGPRVRSSVHEGGVESVELVENKLDRTMSDVPEF
jgi:hypothetical protein